MLTTKGKIGIARLLNRAIVGARSQLGMSPVVDVKRHGLNWRLDLNEGIDLAIYLGLYQKAPRRIIDAWIRSGSLVLDLGANIGSHALPFAQLVGQRGRLVAIEPTDFAFAKLSTNVALNPALSEQTVLVQAAIADASPGQETTTLPNREFYSRWPLTGDPTARHAKHLGQFETAGGARFVALDILLDELRSEGRISGPVQFIKLDVDGHELDVLRSGRRTFLQDRPAMLIEIAPHIQDEVPGRFETLITTLNTFGYRLESAETGQPLQMSTGALRKHVKMGGSVDAMALPS